MKITGTRSTITFDLENGFLIKAQGELLINKKFVVYKDSMTQWEPPHENLPITQREIENIINTAKKMESNQTIQLRLFAELYCILERNTSLYKWSGCLSWDQTPSVEVKKMLKLQTLSGTS